MNKYQYFLIYLLVSAASCFVFDLRLPVIWFVLGPSQHFSFTLLGFLRGNVFEQDGTLPGYMIGYLVLQLLIWIAGALLFVGFFSVRLMILRALIVAAWLMLSFVNIFYYGVRFV